MTHGIDDVNSYSAAPDTHDFCKRFFEVPLELPPRDSGQLTWCCGRRPPCRKRACVRAFVHSCLRGISYRLRWIHKSTEWSHQGHGQFHSRPGPSSYERACTRWLPLCTERTARSARGARLHATRDSHVRSALQYPFAVIEYGFLRVVRQQSPHATRLLLAFARGRARQRARGDEGRQSKRNGSR